MSKKLSAWLFVLAFIWPLVLFFWAFPVPLSHLEEYSLKTRLDSLKTESLQFRQTVDALQAKGYRFIISRPDSTFTSIVIKLK